MSSTILVKLLVGGLAMYVPGDDGEMRVLLPEVSTPKAVGAVTVPAHTGWFGYWLADGTQKCLDGFRGDAIAASGRLCWKALSGDVVDLPPRVGPVGDDPGPRDNFLWMFAKLPGTGQAFEVRDFSWVPSFGRIDPAFRLRRDVLEANLNRCPDRLNAYAKFDATRKSACRLAGEMNRFTGSFGLQTYGFGSPFQPAALSREQALATAVEFEIEVAGPQARVTLWPRQGAPIELDLAPQSVAGAAPVVYLALVQNQNSPPAGAIHDHDPQWDDHFRAYYLLAEGNPPPLQKQRIPRRLIRERSFDPEELNKACRSPFLFDVGAAATPTGRVVEGSALQAKVNAMAFVAGDSNALVMPQNVPARTPGATVALSGPPLCPGVTVPGSG